MEGKNKIGEKKEQMDTLLLLYSTPPLVALSFALGTWECCRREERRESLWRVVESNRSVCVGGVYCCCCLRRRRMIRVRAHRSSRRTPLGHSMTTTLTLTLTRRLIHLFCVLTMMMMSSAQAFSTAEFHPTEEDLSRVAAAKFISCPG